MSAASVYELARVTLELRRRRRRLGIDQEVVAQQLGVDQSEISKWELGRREPTFRNLHQWAAALGLRLQLVMKEQDPTNPE